MNMHGIKMAALIVGVSVTVTALMVGSIILGQILFPGWGGGLGAVSICVLAMFAFIAWAESR